ncbi:hypothetical protein TRV_07738, partial [Trichophyton verrucosum HKI 0517]
TPPTPDSQVTNIKTKTVKMPKEKTTTRKTKRGVEKKKKGKLILSLTLWQPQAMANRWTVDPNAPKRGLSAYMIFANEQRAAVREENPNITFGQVGKVLGERWKALSDKQRVPYEEKAATDKQRYEDEKAAYN